MTVPDRIKIPAAFWLGVDRLAVRRSELLRAAGLPVLATHLNAQLDTAQFFALWRGLETLHGPDVGFAMSAVLDNAVLPPSLLVGYHAQNFGDALHRVARFKSLCAPEELQVATEGTACVVSIRWQHCGNLAPASLIDATLMSILSVGRTGTGKDIQPQRLTLRRSFHPNVADYFKCPVQWKAREDKLYLRTSDLALPFLSYNREMLDMLDHALNEQLDGIKSSMTISGQVKWLLRRSLAAGRPELRYIAQQLATSERSLQRRLNDEGHSFQSLLSEVRHELAREYLVQPANGMTEVACLLGYDDLGSFYRAFQKWEGKPPAEWRDSLQPKRKVVRGQKALT